MRRTEPSTKVCTRCSRELPRAEFHVKVTATSGLQPMCKPCQKAYAREWYAANSKGPASRRRRHTQNHERHVENHRRWYEANRAKRIEANRRWRAANPEKAATLDRRAVLRRRAGRTDESAAYAGIVVADPCVYCGGLAYEVEHIQPLAGGGSNHWTNLAGACGPCNRSKRDTPLLHFLLRRMR